jgi:hypothetical protein
VNTDSVYRRRVPENQQISTIHKTLNAALIEEEVQAQEQANFFIKTLFE